MCPHFTNFVIGRERAPQAPGHNMNDITQCREDPPCLSRPDGMGGELQSEYKNRPQDIGCHEMIIESVCLIAILQA